jgi:GNAT superfamily N-acetyltransferase
MNDEHAAALTWGMVRRDFHRQGIGRQFLRYRLNAIREHGRAQVVQIHTVQLVQAFFAREGFAVVDVIPNGYGIGLDKVIMRLQVK